MSDLTFLLTLAVSDVKDDVGGLDATFIGHTKLSKNDPRGSRATKEKSMECWWR